MCAAHFDELEKMKFTIVLDLAFAMDCTGSMDSYILTAQANIRKIVEEIMASEKSDIHLALVEYRDHPPQDSSFVTRTHDFTGSVSKMKGWLDDCSASGGGDGPEAVADALHDVLKLSWRPQATKICILISDAPPHGLVSLGDGFPNGCPFGFDPIKIAKQLAENGITLYVLGCEPAVSRYKDFFMAMAHLTGGQYVPLSCAGDLAQVIIGGAQEEISLDKWMSDVEEEVQLEIETGREIDEEKISRRVQEKLNVKGAKVKQLINNNEVLSAPSEIAKRMSTCNEMSDVKIIFKESDEKRENSRSFRRASSPVPPDNYDVTERNISDIQISRMVQKSKMRKKKVTLYV